MCELSFIIANCASLKVLFYRENCNGIFISSTCSIERTLYQNNWIYFIKSPNLTNNESWSFQIRERKYCFLKILILKDRRGILYKLKEVYFIYILRPIKIYTTIYIHLLGYEGYLVCNWGGGGLKERVGTNTFLFSTESSRLNYPKCILNHWINRIIRI